MKFVILFLLAGCSANRAKMTGTVLSDQMYFERMIAVEVTNAPDSGMWVKLNKRQIKHVKSGDKVIFYVKTKKVEYEAR